MDEWAEIRRLKFVENLSQRGIVRRTGRNRRTVVKAIESAAPPRYKRKQNGSKLDPFKPEIQRLLGVDPEIPSQRIRELISELGYGGGKTICDDYVRELRPVMRPPRSFQRTNYRPGEILQFDLWQPKHEVPVGWGQTRKAYIVVCALGYSRAGAGTLIFSKRAPDILQGLWRALERLGGLPEQLVTDREGSLHAGGGRPSPEFLTFAGSLGAKPVNLDAGDCQAKGVVERLQGYMATNFEPGRQFASELDLQNQLDTWFDQRANMRFHRTLRERPAERLLHERESLRALPKLPPETGDRFCVRVPAQPFVRVDTNDYSIDPAFVGQRIEVRATQREITAITLGAGDVAAAHRRIYARHQTITDPAHQAKLDALRAARLARSGERQAATSTNIEVQLRDLSRYDALVA